ncbi:MAG: 30S ribosomal protein S2 [bacterium]|nr:30S ribosomal protein S2 [bacterium]
MAKTPSMKELLEAGAHFGHQTRRWNPKMGNYIFGARAGVHILDLEKTEEKLKEAAEFVRETVEKGGSVVFLATKKQAQEIVKTEAERVGAMFLVERWLGGLFTNFEAVKKTIEKIPQLEENLKPESKFTKKEQLLISRELAKLNRNIGGIKNLEKLPEILFVVDAKKEDNAIKEARKTGVKVVSIVDTNADPTSVDFPIPANDDAIKSISLVVKTIADAFEEGKAANQKRMEKEAKKVEKEKED